MDFDSPSDALPLLACLYRERRSGLLCVGAEDAPLRVLLREGEVVGLGPAGPPGSAPRPQAPRNRDSVHERLDRVLVEVGLRGSPKPPAAAPEPRGTSARSLLVEALASGAARATFAEGEDALPDVTETAGATEPLILEAVRALPDVGTVRAALGDLDQRLAVTAALAEERTLTLTEGYLLSLIDGTSSAREVLHLVPLDPHETERTLLGLLLTGRVEYRPAAARSALAQPEPEAAPEPAAAPEPSEASPVAEAAPSEEAPSDPTDPEGFEEAFPEVALVEEEARGEPEPFPEPEPILDAEPTPSAPLDEATRGRKKEIWEAFHSLPSKNHFEVLGVEPGCTDADVKRAYAALVRRFHPDAQGDSRLKEMHEFLEAILIRAREALEVLETARSRAQYESKSGILRSQGAAPARTPSLTRPAPGTSARASDPLPRSTDRAETGPPPAGPVKPPPASAPLPDYVPPEEILFRARLLLSQARYWDVIQFLEGAVPQMEPRRNQHKGRILLAKARAKNPKWVRQAVEDLKGVVREDPNNVEAHYELGLLYKQTGQVARAQAAFRRVLELRPEHRDAAAELGLDDGPAPGGGLWKRLLGRGKAS